MNRSVRPPFHPDVADEVAFLAGEAGADVAGAWADAVWETIEELEDFPPAGQRTG